MTFLAIETKCIRRPDNSTFTIARRCRVIYLNVALVAWGQSPVELWHWICEYHEEPLGPTATTRRLLACVDAWPGHSGCHDQYQWSDVLCCSSSRSSSCGYPAHQRCDTLRNEPGQQFWDRRGVIVQCEALKSARKHLHFQKPTCEFGSAYHTGLGDA
jgi:hypothetical protein